MAVAGHFEVAELLGKLACALFRSRQIGQKKNPSLRRNCYVTLT